MFESEAPGVAKGPGAPNHRGLGGTRRAPAVSAVPMVGDDVRTARPRLAVVLIAGALVLFGCSTPSDDPTSATTTPTPSVSTASGIAGSPTTSGTTTTSPPPPPSTTVTTTTVAPQPPSLLVTDPAADQIITTRVHTFRGRTDPGAVVAVGSSVAGVNDQGEWSLDLTLPPGSSATTVVATNPTSQLSTSVRLQLRYEPDTTLGWGGIDGAPCDTPYEEAMRTLTDLFGEPYRLSPPGQGAVQAEWSWYGGSLVATFADWSLCIMGHSEYLHFMGWELRGDSAGLTFEGIAPGSTVAELMAQVESDRESCDEARETGGGGEGCVSLDPEPREDGYRFFLSDGMFPPPLFGYADGPDPDTAVILVLASKAPE